MPGEAMLWEMSPIVRSPTAPLASPDTVLDDACFGDSPELLSAELLQAVRDPPVSTAPTTIRAALRPSPILRIWNAFR